MKSIVLVAFTVSIAALAGCGSEAGSSSEGSPTPSTASPDEARIAAPSPRESLASSAARVHQASVALDQYLSRIVVDPDGKVIVPEPGRPLSAAEITALDAVGKSGATASAGPNVPVVIEEQPIWAICAYGGTVLPPVCCESDGTCSVTGPRY